MSSQPSLKVYVSCATQTDLTLVLQPSCNCNALWTPDGPPAISERDTDSEGLPGQSESFPQVCEGAYIQHSGASEMAKLDAPRQKAKPSAIGHNRPTNALMSLGRIVSLPVGGSRAASEDSLERKMRVVSLPEAYKVDLLKADSMQDDLSETIHPSEQKKVVDPTRSYPKDLPRTPSPPSSPDSVMIVGNDSTHVSTSFLRRSYADDDGWVTWASSPPRPIPALHGPLSLPYARCPSGAEGTLVEGDDLPHKIWGLGIDDAGSRSASRGVAFLSQSSESPRLSNISLSAPPASGQTTKTMPLSSHRDAVIDLSKPSTFHMSRDDSAVPSGKFPLTSYAGLGGSDTARTPVNLPASTVVDLPRVWGPDCAQMKSSTEDYELQIRETGYSGHFGASNKKNRHQLNRSAPLFVPGSLKGDGHWRSAYTQLPDIDEKLRPHNRVLSQLTHLEQEYPASSPSTCSPAWSPVFPGIPFEAEFSRQLPSKHTLVASYAGDPKVYSPQMDLDEQSSRLYAMIQQFNGQDLSDVPRGYSGGLERRLDWNFSNDRLTHRYDKERAECAEAYTPPRLSDRSRKLPYQPRSVPLARLIQRRLSAVTEEEANVALPGINPAMREGDRYSSKPTSKLEPMILSNPKAMNNEAAQHTTSVEVMPDDDESNAIVKLPRKSTNSLTAVRPPDIQSHIDTITSTEEGGSQAGHTIKRARTRRTSNISRVP